MKNIVVLLLSLGTCLNIFGQTRELVYLNPQDSTSNYYLAFKPVGLPDGLLFLLTSFGESPQIAANETDIQIAATKAGLLTVFASLQHGTQSFFIDSLSQSTLKEFILEIQHQYKLTDKPFYLGGFSLGGSGVVKYAESAYSQTALPKPKAIFAIDPPLDFERMYYSLEYALRNSHVEIAKREADYLIKRLQYEFQSIPQLNNKTYQILSPYSFTDTTQSAIQN